jgi:hypothetical protein
VEWYNVKKGKKEGDLCLICGEVVDSFECKEWFKDPAQRDFRKQFRDAQAVRLGQKKTWLPSRVDKKDVVGLRLEATKIFVSDEDFVQKYLMSLRDLEDIEITKLLNPEGATTMEGVVLHPNEFAEIPKDLPWYWATLFYDTANVMTEVILSADKELRSGEAQETLLFHAKKTAAKRSIPLQDPVRRKCVTWGDVSKKLKEETDKREDRLDAQDREDDEDDDGPAPGGGSGGGGCRNQPRDLMDAFESKARGGGQKARRKSDRTEPSSSRKGPRGTAAGDLGSARASRASSAAASGAGSVPSGAQSCVHGEVGQRGRVQSAAALLLSCGHGAAREYNRWALLSSRHCCRRAPAYLPGST